MIKCSTCEECTLSSLRDNVPCFFFLKKKVTCSGVNCLREVIVYSTRVLYTRLLFFFNIKFKYTIRSVRIY